MALIQTKEAFEKFISTNWNQVNAFIDDMEKDLPIPLYTSVDIRESKTKYAPVDNNIYPAGFNNICQLDLDASAKHFEDEIKKYGEHIQRIAIIPESHTKNLFYLDHLAYLIQTLSAAGFEVDLISLDESIFNGKEKVDLLSHSQFALTIHRAYAKDDQICLSSGDCFDFIILNNDQSHPIPINWKEITTPVHPTPFIGWYRRQKAEHFHYYHQVIEQFCQRFEIDPELLRAKFKFVEEVDFSSKEGLDRLAKEVDQMLETLPPGNKIFVKASQGTYGMGIMVVDNGDQILAMNRKGRNKMDVGKNKKKFTSTLIQEGIETILKYDDMPAEVTIYLIGGQSVGGFMRANTEKSSQSNLNSRGMVFKKYCISEIRANQDHKAKEAVYSIIARLSTVASGLEVQKHS